MVHKKGSPSESEASLESDLYMVLIGLEMEDKTDSFFNSDNSFYVQLNVVLRQKMGCIC